MSETVMRVDLAELETVRVCCQKCPGGAVAEVPVARLGQVYASAACPFCGAEFADKGAPNPFAQLADVLEKLNRARARDAVRLEFVLPRPPAP